MMKAGVKIYGSFAGGETTLSERTAAVMAANKSTLSGDLNGDDVITGSGSTLSITGNEENCYHVVFNVVNGLTSTNSLLDGFTITGGYANGIPPKNEGGQSTFYGRGGGMFNLDSSPSLNNITFVGNSVDLNNINGISPGHGGGLYSRNTQSILTNVIFINNLAYNGGGMYSVGVNGDQSFLYNVTFVGNKTIASGGGMYINSDFPLLGVVLNNVVFVRNRAGLDAGGLFNNYHSAVLNNVNFVRNSAARRGGGAYIIRGSPSGEFRYAPEVRNTIFEQNTATGSSPDIVLEGGAIPLSNTMLQYSQSTYGSNFNLGEGMLYAQDPLFANIDDPDGPDDVFGTTDDGLRLLPCSPAINVGNNTSVPLFFVPDGFKVSTDFTGNPRIFGTTIDLGAYEYQSAPPAAITPISGGASNPTTCGGTNGSITYRGFLSNTTYSVTYKKNTNAVEAANFTSNGSGELTITGLGEGRYTNMIATYGACVSNDASGDVILLEPSKPTAIISGTTTVCQSGTSPNITFTGQSGAAPYTFTYKINEGTSQTVTTTIGSRVTVPVPTETNGEFTYSLVSVSNPNNCSQSQTGSATVTVNPLPTATISGTTTVCQNSPTPSITFTGSNATAPYTFTYKINDGSPQTVTTVSGNSITVPVSTTAAGTFTYTLVSVSESSSTACSQSQTGSATVTVNPLPTASISGTVTVCQNSASPSITFTGSNATAPYTFTYKINDGAPQTVTTVSGNSVTVPVSTSIAGTFTYTLVSVSESSSTACSQSQTGSATVTVNPLPTATISGTVTVCQNSPTPSVTFTGLNATAPYTFTYKINDGAPQTVPTVSGNSVTVPVSTIAAGTFTYTLVSVSESSSTACSQSQTGSVTVTVNPLPTASISGTVTVCQNSASPSITFTGSNATAPYTFTYKINDGAPQTVTTVSGNSVTVPVSTTAASTFTYTLVSVSESSSMACRQSQTGSATVTVNPSPTASISGTVTVCQNSASPSITFTGSNATAPYTFTYKINDGAPQTVTTVSGNSVTVPVSTTAASTFTYTLVSVSESSSMACRQSQTGSATVTVNPSPTASISGTVTVCQNSPTPSVTFTGANATAPYTFTYKINDGSPQTVKTVSGNSVTVPVSTIAAGTFTYTLVSVSESSSTACSQSQTGSATVTVNPLPTASISGTVTVCQNSASPSITFTGSNATAPYTFTYKINDGAPQTVTTVSGNSVTVPVSTTAASTFTYTLVSVSESSSMACRQSQTGSATVTVNPSPTASISGTVTVCQNSASPSITFTGANAMAPYTFTYKINDGAPQTVKTVSGNSVTVPVSTIAAGTFTYTLVSVSESSSTACSQSQTGSATVTVNPSPTASISGTVTVCQNSASPSITFTGANAMAPYTFTYKINDGSPQTVKTVSGNSVTVPVSTIAAGTFTYTLVSVSESSSTACSQSQTGSVTVTVNPLPTASISGTTSVCQNSPTPSVTFTGLNSTAPYTFTYKINDGAPQTVKTVSGNSVTVPVSTTTVGEFTYTLLSVSESSSTSCSQAQSGSATLTVNPLPTASISGTTSVCQNSPTPSVTFTGLNATAPYTFTYKINDGAPQTVTTVSGNSVTVPVSTNTAGTFTYTLVSVSESSSMACRQSQTGSVVVKVQGKPTITLSTFQQTLNEGNTQTFCDTDANPVNSLEFGVTRGCVVGTPVWRVQVGGGAWSEWSTSIPITQPSNNQPHRYQAACDASCPVTYTSPIMVQINYRASTPQQVALVADGVTVKEGESKEACNIEGDVLIFNATCGAGEFLLYSVDGGDYSSVVPTQLVDGQFHNYRVRCRKSDGTASCIESESGVMRLKLTNGLGQVPVANLNVTSGCGTPVVFSGTASCGSLTTVWYNASTNVALPTLPSQTPAETTSYYVRCQAGGGCLSEKSNVVTYTVIPVGVAPVVSVSSEVVCAGTSVTISANCPSGSTTSWSTGVTTPSFEVSFNNVMKQTYWAKCIFSGGCQSAESARKDVNWNAFVVTMINVGESKSGVKVNDHNAWSSQFITRDGGPELAQSTQVNPTLYYVENVNKTAPRYWTINVDACALGTDGSLTFDLLATPETGVPQSFNTHENNAPYFMYANREGWTELYAQNHPAYGFYQDNGTGGNVYDAGLPKGLYKLGVRYWDQKGWGSIYPSTRKPQGNVLAYQEYWFRIQSKDGVGVGAARTADSGQQAAVVGEQGAIIPRGLFVHPNPVTNILRLQVIDSKGQDVQATLMDASGRELLQRKFIPETNTHHEEFGVSSLANGLYFLKILRAEQETTLKVIKVQ